MISPFAEMAELERLAAIRRWQQRQMEIETELRRSQLHWAAVLCSCIDRGTGSCIIHGQHMVADDGSVL